MLSLSREYSGNEQASRSSEDFGFSGAVSKEKIDLNLSKENEINLWHEVSSQANIASKFELLIPKNFSRADLHINKVEIKKNHKVAGSLCILKLF